MQASSANRRSAPRQLRPAHVSVVLAGHLIVVRVLTPASGRKCCLWRSLHSAVKLLCQAYLKECCNMQSGSCGSNRNPKFVYMRGGRSRSALDMLRTNCALNLFLGHEHHGTENNTNADQQEMVVGSPRVIQNRCYLLVWGRNRFSRLQKWDTRKQVVFNMSEPQPLENSRNVSGPSK